MKHGLISFLECGVMIQYQDLTFELVYCYLILLDLLSIRVGGHWVLTPGWGLVRLLDYNHSFAN